MQHRTILVVDLGCDKVIQNKPLALTVSFSGAFLHPLQTFVIIYKEQVRLMYRLCGGFN